MVVTSFGIGERSSNWFHCLPWLKNGESAAIGWPYDLADEAMGIECPFDLVAACRVITST